MAKTYTMTLTTTFRKSTEISFSALNATQAKEFMLLIMQGDSFLDAAGVNQTIPLPRPDPSDEPNSIQFSSALEDGDPEPLINDDISDSGLIMWEQRRAQYQDLMEDLLTWADQDPNNKRELVDELIYRLEPEAAQELADRLMAPGTRPGMEIPEE